MLQVLLRAAPAILLAAAFVLAPPTKEASREVNNKSHYVGWNVGKLNSGQHFKFADNERVYQKVGVTPAVERVINPFLTVSCIYVDPENGQLGLIDPEVRVRKVTSPYKFPWV